MPIMTLEVPKGDANMPGKLRAGVIGVGTFGSLHTRVYAELESVDLVAVACAIAESAEKQQPVYL